LEIHYLYLYIVRFFIWLLVVDMFWHSVDVFWHLLVIMYNNIGNQ